MYEPGLFILFEMDKSLEVDLYGIIFSFGLGISL